MAKKKKTPVKKSKPAAQKKASPAKADFLKDIWPNERDLLVRPERLRYVRQIVKPTGCVFCEAANAEDRQARHVLYRSEKAMVLLNKYPYNNGHLLILPKSHQGDLEALEDDVYFEIQKILRASIQILKDTYQCGGLNVGLNLGSAAGAGIPEHLHYHVLPRWQGDTNFFPLLAKTKVVVETLEDTYKNLKSAFAKLEKELK